MVAATYWDTSCVLKLYCREKDSAEYLQRVRVSTQPLCSSVLLASELIFALWQKETRKEIKSSAAKVLYGKFLDDLAAGRFWLLPLGDDVREEARRIAAICYGATPPVPLRTLDGLHLASASVAGCREILSTDARVKSAVSILGLTVGC